MKKQLLLFSLILFCFFSAKAFTDKLIVKGYLKDSAGLFLANKAVRIANADSTSGCVISHTVYTNPNGYYVDTITCSSTIGKLLVMVEDCRGQRLLREVNRNAGSVYVEVNFSICTAPAPLSCKAAFRDSVIQAGTRFMSQLSAAAPGDSIVSRVWNFGDSSPLLTGNRVDPSHVYAKPGVYNVCLTIKTKNGCESKECRTTTVREPAPPPPLACKAAFRDSAITAGTRFNSMQSVAPPGDSIISRTWNFGDSSPLLTGNRVDPSHTYTKPGVYNVCLTIKTRNGCESKECRAVTVKETAAPPACKASFTYTYKDSIVRFNSTGSFAPAGDSIISRTWIYIDSTGNTGTLILRGNVADTAIRYTIPGKYTVYLSILTGNGCESKTSVTVTIPPKPAGCTLQANAVVKEKVIARKFRFSSSASLAPGDSIVYRKWSFGDGTSMEGNEISPLKEYRDTGVYNVCVLLKTKNGCEKQFCLVLAVKDSLPPAPAACKATFVFTALDKKVTFNSAASAGTTATDSIVSRTWLFGDSTAPLAGLVNPVHTYATYGSYTVTLYTRTKNGCESKFTAVVQLRTPDSACKAVAQFTATRIAPRKMQFNSIPSTTGPADSIIERRWRFGDGAVQEDKRIDPVKEFPFPGVYTVCLSVKTAKGCTAEICKQVNVQDSTGLNESAINFVKLVAINPNPVITRMLATIWSRNAGTDAELTIVDIYGIPKLTLKKNLAQGNNVVEIPVSNLYRGPYFLQVSTRGSRDSKMFYKL